MRRFTRPGGPGHPAPHRSRRPSGVAALALAAALAIGGLLPAAAARAAEATPLEVSLGLGGASASEASLFNLPQDSRSSPDALVDFRIRQNVTETLAFGFHLYGTIEETPSYIATDPNGNIIGTVDFDLSVFHLGLDVRYMLPTRPVRPFVEFGVSYVSGSVEDKVFGNLQLNGGSVGGGPGLQFEVNRHLALGVQGLFAAGTAKWEKLPFPGNSRNRDYEPGFAGVEGFLTYRWRR